MRQAIEQCCRHLCIAKHAGPFAEAQLQHYIFRLLSLSSNLLVLQKWGLHIPVGGPLQRWHSTDVNPLSGAILLMVEPRLTSATRWYVTADPGEIEGLEFAYLSGNEGPQVESRSGWDVDGVEIWVILNFGAGYIDHRGWFQIAGA